MEDGILNSKLANLETMARAANQLADHALRRITVLEAALSLFAKHAVIDFPMLKAAVHDEYGDASPKVREDLDTIIAEFRSRI